MSGFSTCPTITRLYYLSASRVHTCSSDPDWPMLLLSLWLHYSINHDLLVPHRLLHYPREYTIYHSINEFLHGFSKNKKYLNWKWEDKIVFASSVRYTSNNHLWTIDKKKGGKKEGKKDRCFFFSNKRYPSFPSLCFRFVIRLFIFEITSVLAIALLPCVPIPKPVPWFIWNSRASSTKSGAVETRLSPPAMRTRCLHFLLNRRISQRWISYPCYYSPWNIRGISRFG